MESVVNHEQETATLTVSIKPIDGHQDIVEQSQKMAIVDQSSYELAMALWKTVKVAISSIEGERKQLKDPVIEAGKRIDGKAKAAKQPFETAKTLLEDKIRKYQDEQQHKQKVEQERLLNEAQVRQDDRALESAQVALDGGNGHVADAIIDSPGPPSNVETASTGFERIAGGPRAKNPKAECYDMKALVKFASDNDWALGLLKVNESALNQQAKSQGDHFSIPGCKRTQ